MTTPICIILLLFQFVFLLRLVMSFFPIPTGTAAASVRDVAVAVTDPVVAPLRRSLPPLPGMMAGFGLAEILVLIALQIIIRIVCF
ncbi:MAG: YggT family protein [Acidimicrobiales bacterium]